MRLVALTERGLYCERGDFYIDPWRPVDYAVVTHGHSDHARWGSKSYLTAAKGVDVVQLRVGAEAFVQGLAYGERRSINDVVVSFHPAGHILGSAQVRIEHAGEVWVVSGDYKTAADTTCDPFEAVRCHVFISETTFGLPIYRWRPEAELFQSINSWWQSNRTAGRTSVILAYALGKSQRVLSGLDDSIGPILFHGAMDKLTDAYRRAGVALPRAERATTELARETQGTAMVLAPPSAQGTPWLRKFGEKSLAITSGWMQIRGMRRRRAVDQGFVLSDHADWPGLLSAIEATGAEEVWLTHGYSDVMARYLSERGLLAAAIHTQFEGEAAEAALEQQRNLVQRTYRELPRLQRFLWLKLITGSFRVGVARTLVNRALAEVATVAPEVMAHRLMGQWQPTGDDYLELMRSETSSRTPEQPYPFFLAHPLTSEPAALGAIDAWHAEWKWDGIRAQLIHREGAVLVWSRGEELITDRFPEVAEVGRALPDGVVLDGEILAWRNETPLPFAILQKRIGRKAVGPKTMRDAPVAFMAFDLLEQQGEDVRSLPLRERRSRLEAVVVGVHPDFALRLSPRMRAATWDDLVEQRAQARDHNVEGLMLKRLESVYGVGRPRGDWWKWKVDPYTVDAVLIYAQKGHGRRADLFTDYTFGVWDQGQLVPIAKAYSGLTDAEIREVNAYVRRNTLESFGPVRVVQPQLVFELHFEGIQRSPRHKSGIAVRFPRIHRWRRDKEPADADTLETVRKLANLGPEAVS